MPLTDARPRLTSGDTRPPQQNRVSSRRSAALRLASPLHTIFGMINRVGAFILVSSLFGVGCGVGGDDLEELDPNPNKVICSDVFKVTGTFVPGTPARPVTDPEDPTVPFTGCWPVGTWNFTLSLDPSDELVEDFTGDLKPDRCGAVSGTLAASFDASYSFVVTRTPDVEQDYVDSYALTGAVASSGKTLWNDKLVYRIKVSEGGGRECEGGVELYSQDTKSYWNLHPNQGGTTIDGSGTFYLYEEAQL